MWRVSRFSAPLPCVNLRELQKYRVKPGDQELARLVQKNKQVMVTPLLLVVRKLWASSDALFFAVL